MNLCPLAMVTHVWLQNELILFGGEVGFMAASPTSLSPHPSLLPGLLLYDREAGPSQGV